jgi:putative transposase
MSSYHKILYHIIFHTKYNVKTLNPEHSRELFAYILGIIRNKKGRIYRINGVENHLHILCDLHPSLALADFVKDIKTATSVWLKQSGKFPGFRGWAIGYSAFTCNWRDKDKLIDYIKNQQAHHHTSSYEAELRRLLKEHDVMIDERYFL